ncbi:MAG: YdcF family protein [Firmicutes bacterium]|nr:YdcF family protein [Bacillota bacterium]
MNVNSILENIQIIAPFFIGSWTIFLLSFFLGPQKLRTSFFLMVALFFSAFFMTGFLGDENVWAMMVLVFLCFILVLLTPLLLFLNGLKILRKESFSLANALSLLLGIFIGIGEFVTIGDVFGFFDSPLYNHFSWFFMFVSLSAIYFSFHILTFVVYMLFIQFMPHRMDFDYVIIHGCGLIDGNKMTKLLSNRVDKAIEIYQKCKKKTVIIPSGGKGSDESISEAQAMKEYLLEKGIPEEAIVLEDESKTTMENLINSKQIIESREGSHKTALVSSNYHVYRCLYFASKLKFKCTGFGGKVAAYYWPSATLREYVAIFSKGKHFVHMALGYIFWVILPVLFVFR